jgi:serine O-acetyltransferase
MIKNRKDLRDYLQHDAIAYGIRLGSLKERYFHSILDQNWIFYKRLRLVEYYKNKNRNLFENIYFQILRYRFRKVSIRLGFSIPANTCGKGLAVLHYGSIVINANARLGKNCMIHSCVNIGTNGGSSKAPIIGNNVFIGPGAKIYGEITIADNVSIGANAVVNKSILEKNAVVAGVPAKIIKYDEKLWWEKNRLKLEK